MLMLFENDLHILLGHFSRVITFGFEIQFQAAKRILGGVKGNAFLRNPHGALLHVFNFTFIVPHALFGSGSECVSFGRFDDGSKTDLLFDGSLVCLGLLVQGLVAIATTTATTAATTLFIRCIVSGAVDGGDHSRFGSCLVHGDDTVVLV